MASSARGSTSTNWLRSRRIVDRGNGAHGTAPRPSSVVTLQATRAHNCRSALADPRSIGHYALLRIRPVVVVLAIIVASCSSSHYSLPSDPVAALKAAATRSFATTSATFHGVMTAQGSPQVLLAGTVDFRDRRDSFTLAPAPGAKRYPPYEARFVGGWNYVAIDAVVRRPPTVHGDTMWIAFPQDASPGLLPVPDRAVAPELLVGALDHLLTHSILEARFIDGRGSNPRRVTVRFGGVKYSKLSFTYSIDGTGRIVAVTTGDQYQQSNTLDFSYVSGRSLVVAPSVGVQRLNPDAPLYPTSTTKPSRQGPVGA
jgi:hypothetical protein